MLQLREELELFNTRRVFVPDVDVEFWNSSGDRVRDLSSQNDFLGILYKGNSPEIYDDGSQHESESFRNGDTRSVLVYRNYSIFPREVRLPVVSEGFEWEKVVDTASNGSSSTASCLERKRYQSSESLRASLGFMVFRLVSSKNKDVHGN